MKDSRIMRAVGLIFVLLLFDPMQTVRAAELPVFTSPYDFSLKEPQDPPPPGGAMTYAFSGAAPTWSISAWDIPGQKLSPFLVSKVGADTLFLSRAPEATVTIDRKPDGTESYELHQDGTELPCGPDDKARESDLFAGPNGEALKSPDANAFLIPPNQMALTEMSHLIARATITFRHGDAVPAKGCAVSQGSPLISVIVNNLIAHQTLFYQLALSTVCGPQPAPRAQMCNHWRTQPESSFFFTINPFGVDDALPLLGQSWFSNNETRPLNVDVLPRILLFIATGPEPMDHNPKHWVLDNYYNGQHIWGDITMTTIWRDVRLTVITP